MSEVTDFFFGEYNVKNGQASVYFPTFVEKLKAVGPTPRTFISKQLNRFLSVNNNRLLLTDGTSYPPFNDFLSLIDPDSVGVIDIYARTDVNDAVNATLACDIWMDSGIITVVPHWCAYKDIRAAEVVGTLLCPLHRLGLHSRTRLRKGRGEFLPLTRGDSDADLTSEVCAVFELAKYPRMFEQDDRPDWRYLKPLRDANAARVL